MNNEYIAQPNNVVLPKEVEKIQPQVVVGVATQEVELTIECPKCGNQDYWKYGITKLGKQRYYCRNCKHKYVIKPFQKVVGVAAQGGELIIKCPDCSGEHCIKRGLRLGKQKYRCKDCRREFILNYSTYTYKPLENNGVIIKCPDCSGDHCVKGCISKSGKQTYSCKDCKRHFILNSTYKRLEKSDDVWIASDLGLQRCLYHGPGKLNFACIQQEWLKRDIKRFIRYIATTTTSFTRLNSTLNNLRYFSIFLYQNPLINQIEDINRSVIIDYLSYLNQQQQLAPVSKGKCISTLASLFEIGTVNKWFNIDPYLIRKEDYPRRSKALPRYIPDDVVLLLNQHLNTLPEPVMRMVLVIQECGLRIGELCLLPLNCLSEDSKGGWFIQFMRLKMKFETTLPISIELAEVIKEQQAYIQQHLGKDFSYLFCGRRGGRGSNFVALPKVMKGQVFGLYLKRLADKFDIKDSIGKRWDFQSHQFRHTVGTRMINNGVPQHIIQRYLGHESPTMTSVYAHIFDETLRKEIEKFHESTVVNFQGQTVELEDTLMSGNDDLEWFKKNIQARALEHGYCGRPKMLGDCDIPGFDGCYNCPHWRTNINFLPILKDTLQRTNKVIEKARNCGWELQVKKNEPIQHNLEKVIASLEVEGNE